MIPNLAIIVATYTVTRLLMLGLVPVITTKPNDAESLNAVISIGAVLVIGYFCIQIVNAASDLAPALGV